jgi:hypothetical protein
LGSSIAMSAGILVMSLAGCAVAPMESSDQESVEETENFLISDPSGTITISITQCAAVNVTRGTGFTSCGVASGFALVGGGATIQGSNHPGALLVESRPVKDAQTWFVTAKDHVTATSYKIQAAAIGLKLSGVSADALRGMIQMRELVGTPGHSSVLVARPADLSDIVLGGGAQAEGAAGKQLLVASRPTYSGPNQPALGWQGISKDHVSPDIGHVRAWVISMPACPPGYTGGCLKTTVVEGFSGTGTGYQTISFDAFGAVTGVGAATGLAGSGRLLTDIWPSDVGGVSVNLFASSKDHTNAQSGGTSANMIVLSRR